jgi:hypothetical protein
MAVAAGGIPIRIGGGIDPGIFWVIDLMVRAQEQADLGSGRFYECAADVVTLLPGCEFHFVGGKGEVQHKLALIVAGHRVGGGPLADQCAGERI